MSATYLSVIFLITGAYVSQISISASAAENPFGGVRGVVNATNCGSLGNLTDTRVTDCSALPCNLTSQSSIEIEYTIRANTTINSAQLRRTATPTGKDPMIRIYEIGTLNGGRTHSLTLYDLNNFLSEEVTIQMEVLTDSKEVEICMSGLFNWNKVPPTTPTTTTTTTSSI